MDVGKGSHISKKQTKNNSDDDRDKENSSLAMHRKASIELIHNLVPTSLDKKHERSKAHLMFFQQQKVLSYYILEGDPR